MEKLKEVIAGIKTNEEVNEAYDLLARKLHELQGEKLGELVIGEFVEFTNSSTGKVVVGKLLSKSYKTSKVYDEKSKTKWTVTTMLLRMHR